MRRAVDFTVRMFVDVSDDLTEDQVQFYVEEHLCLTNLLDDLISMQEHDDEAAVCNLCAHASAKLLPSDVTDALDTKLKPSER